MSVVIASAVCEGLARLCGLCASACSVVSVERSVFSPRSLAHGHSAISREHAPQIVAAVVDGVDGLAGGEVCREPHGGDDADGDHQQHDVGECGDEAVEPARRGHDKKIFVGDRFCHGITIPVAINIRESLLPSIVSAASDKARLDNTPGKSWARAQN